MLSYRISYSDDLQIYTCRKHFSVIGFKASTIHLKIWVSIFKTLKQHLEIAQDLSRQDQEDRQSEKDTISETPCVSKI